MGSLSSIPGQLTPTIMGDMANAACMADGFENIQKLPDPVPGCPNFRRVPGFKVYCCGQPTIAGFEAALNKVCGDKYPKDGPIIWLNMRQEPDVYVNGGPICARPPNKIIDLNGTPKTGGTGIKQLRENIAESKLSYEIMDDAAQAFLKTKIMDNIQKYFYLIVFAAYIREAAAAARDAVEADQKAAVALPTSGKCSIPATQLKLGKTFSTFLSENAGLDTLVDTGKGNLQWERDITPEALVNLESLAAKDFKGNLGKIIHDIYQTAHVMFGDMPQGDHKKRAKYRFASKTIMRILPADMKKEIEGLIEAKKMTMDLYEILGKCTWVEVK